jgi:hypothetical protein
MLVGSLALVVLIISITNRLVRVQKQHPKRVTLPIDYDIMYIHKYPEERVSKVKSTIITSFNCKHLYDRFYVFMDCLSFRSTE